MQKLPKTASINLDADPRLQAWFAELRDNSGLNPTAILTRALDYYRASAGPRLDRLEKQIERLQREVGQLKSGVKTN
jgi:hypothetical protein